MPADPIPAGPIPAGPPAPVPPWDVFVLGRVCVDLYPSEIATPIEEVGSFTKSIGGSAANVAVASARHGHRVTLMTRTGDDPFGRYAKAQIGRFGIDTSHVSPVPEIATVLTFCEIFPPDRFPSYIYRKPTAPDMMITPEDVPLNEVRDARIFWATTTGLSAPPTYAAHVAAWAARGRRPGTILDLDYRPTFWPSEQAAHDAVGVALDHVRIAVGNERECRVAVGERDPHRAADALLERGVELAVVKRGPAGVLAKTREELVEVAPVKVDVVNGLGSGDGFGGALCHGLLSDWPLRRTLEFANAAGAIVATRRECSTAMPTTAEVQQWMAEYAQI
jgi:5-dehydro-2-deoxygluconokinase